MYCITARAPASTADLVAEGDTGTQADRDVITTKGLSKFKGKTAVYRVISTTSSLIGLRFFPHKHFF